jgi:hypothetical protein
MLHQIVDTVFEAQYVKAYNCTLLQRVLLYNTCHCITGSKDCILLEHTISATINHVELLLAC